MTAAAAATASQMCAEHFEVCRDVVARSPDSSGAAPLHPPSRALLLSLSPSWPSTLALSLSPVVAKLQMYTAREPKPRGGERAHRKSSGFKNEVNIIF